MGSIGGEIEFEFVGDAREGRFVPTGKVVGQLLRHVSRGETAEAARLYQGCSPEVTAELFREATMGSSQTRNGLLELFVLARDFASAARCAEMIDDAGRAAVFFETAYEFRRAAELYLKAGDVAKAALMREKTLDFAEAGRLYVQIGDCARGAENLERAGDVIGAARLYLKTGNWKRAGAILQAVAADRAEFFEAGTLLAEILWRTGHRELAIGKLVEVLRAFPGAPQVPDLYMRLGEMFSEAGRPDRAAAAYERVAALRPGHRDVRERLDEMRRLSAVPAAPEPSAAEVAPAAAPSPAAPVPPLDLGLAPAGGGPAEGVQFVDPDLESLGKLPLLAEFERDELRELHRLSGRLSLPAGRTVLREGEPGRGLFVVRSGLVEVTRGSGPNEQVLARLGPGECFGEMSLLGDAPVSADVRTVDDTVLVGIPGEDLARFLYLQERAARKLYRHLAVTLARRLGETNVRLGG